MSVEQENRYQWLLHNLPRLLIDSHEISGRAIGTRSIVDRVRVLEWRAVAQPETVEQAIDKAMQKHPVEVDYVD